MERIFAKGANIIEGIAKKAVGFADDVLQSLDKLISLIKKGSQSFASFIRQILKDFYEWLKGLFKSGKADEILESIIKLSDEAEIILKKYADNAVLGYTKLNRPTVVSVLEGNGKRTFAYSNKTKLTANEIPKGLHPLVKKWLNEADEVIQQIPHHGKCAEPSAISKWLWEVDPTGKMTIEQARKQFDGVVSKAIKIESKKVKPIDHGKYKEACTSCNPLLEYFNITEVH